MSRGLRSLLLVLFFLATALTAQVASANHAWGCYHWSRLSNPFTVTFGNNLSPGWQSYLTTATTDWSRTSGACNNPNNPIRTSVVAGSAHSKNCRPGTGLVEVCNASYGNNGWVGIATIWVNGCHITKGSVKMNEYYFAQPPYTSSAWHQAVMSQEMGHTLGLDHQDEDFYNADLLDACGRGSSMDYSADPTNNTTPNQHDYDELVIIYNHSDGAAVAALGTPDDAGMALEDPSEWGQAIRFANGRGILYERPIGPDQKIVTFVIWAR
jgi:hypothetical protein